MTLASHRWRELGAVDATLKRRLDAAGEHNYTVRY